MKDYLRLTEFLGLNAGNLIWYDKLSDQLIDHEGYRRYPYYDTEGKLTIGVGHNLEEPMSEAAIGLLLLGDIKRAEADLDAVLPIWRQFEEARRLALVDMMFNLGRSRFLTFEQMIACIKAGDWSGAAREALDSKWRRQVKRRAVRVARMLRDGVWV